MIDTAVMSCINSKALYVVLPIYKYLYHTECMGSLSSCVLSGGLGQLGTGLAQVLR